MSKRCSMLTQTALTDEVCLAALLCPRAMWITRGGEEEIKKEEKGDMAASVYANIFSISCFAILAIDISYKLDLQSFVGPCLFRFISLPTRGKNKIRMRKSISIPAPASIIVIIIINGK